MKKAKWFLSIVAFLVAQTLSAQDFFENEKEPVQAFRATLLINAQTTVMPAVGGFEFYIRHRFGFVEMNKTLVNQFLGLDGVSNIRFSFVIPVTATFSTGIGRCKNGKTYDAEFKKLILQQKADNSTPVSLVAYVNTAINTDAENPVQPYAYFADASTPFTNKFKHRLSYNSQLIVSRKFGEILSLQLTPVFIYRNLVPYGEKNYSLICPASGALKTGLNSSFLFEYAYRFNNKPASGIYPASIAFEFGTVSHVFQILVTSTKELDEQYSYSTECSDYRKGKIAFGFNLKRTFWNMKKQRSK
jgi:hypothetical protein